MTLKAPAGQQDLPLSGQAITGRRFSPSRCGNPRYPSAVTWGMWSDYTGVVDYVHPWYGLDQQHDAAIIFLTDGSTVWPSRGDTWRVVP